MPWATITQTLPRALHSKQTLCAGIVRPPAVEERVITSSSWRLSIGQPCSSKSTSTCAEIGVEVASVEM